MFAVPANTIASVVTPPTVHPALIAREYAEHRERWAHLLRYDPDERFVALVDSTPGQQIWLMSWLPGQATDLHDHGGASGAFTVVSGVLTEYVAHRRVANDLTSGRSRVFGPGYAHQVGNVGADPAVSLHVYRATRTMRTVTAHRH